MNKNRNSTADGCLQKYLESMTPLLYSLSSCYTRESERTVMRSCWNYTLRERRSRSRDEERSRTGCGDVTAITSCWPLLTRHPIKKWTRNGTIELPSVSLITAILALQASLLSFPLWRPRIHEAVVSWYPRTAIPSQYSIETEFTELNDRRNCEQNRNETSNVELKYLKIQCTVLKVLYRQHLSTLSPREAGELESL